MNKTLIGNRLRDKREKSALTQEQLAELVDMSSTAISNIETGRANPHFSTIVDIAIKLEMSIDCLISEELQTQNAKYIKEINSLIYEMDSWELEHLRDYIKLFSKIQKKKEKI